MADFCKQCSQKIFGDDFRDLAGMSTKEDDENGLVVATLCEGCGPIHVNSEGKCVSEDCIEGGHGEIRSGAV